MSDHTLDKRIVAEVARGNFEALLVVSCVLIVCFQSLAYLSGAPAVHLVSTDLHIGNLRKVFPMKSN